MLDPHGLYFWYGLLKFCPTVYLSRPAPTPCPHDPVVLPMASMVPGLESAAPLEAERHQALSPVASFPLAGLLTMQSLSWYLYLLCLQPGLREPCVGELILIRKVGIKEPGLQRWLCSFESWLLNH